MVRRTIRGSIAIEPTFLSLGLLAGLVVIRTFLSWTLTLDDRGPLALAARAGVGARDRAPAKLSGSCWKLRPG
ncbi:DUF1622 domain-containing protein [Bradyrhizobium manausense]|uniref:Uncharacterized protein n=1 Tax=Bradyrhizobium manausense TaxID=989370 RepID=A0A0R3D021_9BRAD|nr:DUF1622 domain-containing protein [Bradyrhizobium manausense]KRQ03176.1 hypothetical protein AOQ71_30990 [Bradyrhizobium manausense]